MIRPDGSEGERISLGDTTSIGRELGGNFATDSFLSPKHATLVFGPKGLSVRDENSLNGVYVRLAAETPHKLLHKSMFRIGQEILEYEQIDAPKNQLPEVMGSPIPEGALGKISLVIGRETRGNAFVIPKAGLYLGRERGDVLFPDDGYVSGLHCRIYDENGPTLVDVGSSNGTFVRIVSDYPLVNGSLVLFGQQLFRVEY